MGFILSVCSRVEPSAGRAAEGGQLRAGRQLEPRCGAQLPANTSQRPDQAAGRHLRYSNSHQTHTCGLVTPAGDLNSELIQLPDVCSGELLSPGVSVLVHPKGDVSVLCVGGVGFFYSPNEP